MDHIRLLVGVFLICSSSVMLAKLVKVNSMNSLALGVYSAIHAVGWMLVMW